MESIGVPAVEPSPQPSVKALKQVATCLIHIDGQDHSGTIEPPSSGS